MTNSSLLRAKMFEKKASIKKLSEALGINENTLAKKIKNQSEFKSAEIKKISECLELSQGDTHVIFLES